ncbi:MAG: sulfite exporter TauE/SafE family protein [Deltaproteobacteria bacterium]|nr:sulfite exporter TauE/SafE family protein [Deltaproteobacteria bacterium]
MAAQAWGVAAFNAELLGVSALAGAFGALFGLGGGILIVPVLTLGLGIDLRHAIGASLISVVASSSGAAVGSLRDRLTNVRLAVLLECATTLGALGGALLAGRVPSRALFVAFALVLILSAGSMARSHGAGVNPAPDSDGWSRRLRLAGTYRDAALGREVAYQVRGVPWGMGLMALAGVFSGMLGIGSGALKVPAMDRVMRVPLKVSSATSSFMIGVTAAGSALVWWSRGEIVPLLAAPVALGVLAGSAAGARLLPRLDGGLLRYLYCLVLVALSLEMLLRGLAT